MGNEVLVVSFDRGIGFNNKCTHCRCLNAVPGSLLHIRVFFYGVAKDNLLVYLAF